MKIQLISLLLFAAAAVLPAYPGETEGSSPSPLPSSSPLPSPYPPAVSPTPGSPAQEVSGGFIRYIPNREGDFEWKMVGESVTFLSPVSLEINLLTATALDPQLEGLIIEAAKVHYFTDSGIARNGEARITVRRENMVLTGKGFLWTPQNRQIRVFEDVRLLIKEGGGEGLFPL